MPTLVETLAAELERPRELPSQVVHHLTDTYGLNRDDVGPFLVNELSKLEDYEIDLALAPVFTPSLRDQAVFAEFLSQESVPAMEWPALIQNLFDRPTCAHVSTQDGQLHTVPLAKVTIERYVHRLRLDATIPEKLFRLIVENSPASDQPVLKAICRRAVWEEAARREIFVCFLTATTCDAPHRIEDAVQLLQLVEIYRPADIADLLRQIPHWQEVLRTEINEAASPKPFLNERVQEMHGGGRDQRRQEGQRITARESEQAFLGRLQRLLQN